jgi:hypothetical protein
MERLSPLPKPMSYPTLCECPEIYCSHYLKTQKLGKSNEPEVESPPKKQRRSLSAQFLELERAAIASTTTVAIPKTCTLIEDIRRAGDELVSLDKENRNDVTKWIFSALARHYWQHTSDAQNNVVYYVPRKYAHRIAMEFNTANSVDVSRLLCYPDTKKRLETKMLALGWVWRKDMGAEKPSWDETRKTYCAYARSLS